MASSPSQRAEKLGAAFELRVGRAMECTKTEQYRVSGLECLGRDFVFLGTIYLNQPQKTRTPLHLKSGGWMGPLQRVLDAQSATHLIR